MDCPPANVTNSEDVQNETYNHYDKVIYTAIYHWFYRFGLPTVCMCGFIGNLLNLIILTGKRIQRALRMTERSANTGLVALALSDLMFCALAFPSTFLPENQRYESRGFFLYYGLYCAALINVFIMYSTWLTVVMATERYLAICYPLKARKILSVHRSKVAIVMTFVFSVATNIPVFWRYTYREMRCNNETFYSLTMVELFDSSTFDHAYRTIWATIGNFIPLILLVFFNYCLIREIHRSYAQRKKFQAKSSFRGHSDSESNHRVTMTLISIVVMFLVLVAPSEVVKHIAKLAKENIEENYTYLTIEVITNVMQTVNFSANFILYCCINPSFRRTMKHMFCSYCIRVQERETSRYESCLTGTPEAVRRKVLVNNHAGTVSDTAHRDSAVLIQDTAFVSEEDEKKTEL